MPRKRKSGRKSGIPSLFSAEGKAKMIRDKARWSLDVARVDYLDWIDGDPLRKTIGLQNAIVYGRAALNILGTLKSIYREKFSAWYDPMMQAMIDDSLMSWYIELRNQVLKEGPPPMLWHGRPENMPAVFDRLFAEVPEDGMPFLMGEAGMGWYRATEDGSLPEIHQFKITREIQEEFGVTIEFEGTPAEHAGKPLPDRSARAVLLLCLNVIGSVLDDADRQDFAGVEP